MRKIDLRIVALLGLALLAFAGNSLLNRAALGESGTSAVTFASIRLMSGAVVLSGFCGLTGRKAVPSKADIATIFALFAYAFAFSWAYLALGAATGALILFSMVQFTMVLAGLIRGNRVGTLQFGGLLVALGGLVWLLSPGLIQPPPFSAALMMLAGVSWGVYSVLGQTSGDPIARTGRNFVGAALFAAVLLAILPFEITARGLILAMISGAVTSAMGYVLWYSLLPSLTPIVAATAQLLVPVIVAFSSVVWLGESLSTRLVGASLMILSGIALTIWGPKRAR